MRNRILGIAGLTVRQAIRSRLLLCLFTIMLFLLVVFAVAIRGDGTAVGRLQMLLRYATGGVGIVLSIATLWLACGALAVDIENRRLHLVMVKPIRGIELWLGKWLGVVTVAMAMLVVAGVFLFAAGHIALVRVGPNSPAAETLQQRLLVARHRAGAERVHGKAGQARWQITLPAISVGPPAVATLEYRFVSPFRDQPAIPARWEVVANEGQRYFETDCTAQVDGVNRVTIPVAQLPTGKTVALVFRLRESADAAPSHVTFHPDHPVQLLVPVGGYAGNLVRTLLLMFCRIALLAALGVSMGTIFTFPVAVFAAASIVLATLVTQFFVFTAAPERQRHQHDHAPHQLHEGAAPLSWVVWSGDRLAQGIQVLVGPVLHYRVRGRLADGVTIPWADVYEAAGILIFGYGSVLCGLGCVTLRKREMALPV